MRIYIPLFLSFPVTHASFVPNNAGKRTFQSPNQIESQASLLNVSPASVRSTTRLYSTTEPLPLTNISDPYRLLNINPNMKVDMQKLKSAFRHQVRLYHPDARTSAESTSEEKKLANEDFIKINAAYDYLRLKLESPVDAHGFKSKSTRTKQSRAPNNSQYGNYHDWNDYRTEEAFKSGSSESAPKSSKEIFEQYVSQHVHKKETHERMHNGSDANREVKNKNGNKEWVKEVEAEVFRVKPKNHAGPKAYHEGNIFVAGDKVWINSGEYAGCNGVVASVYQNMVKVDVDHINGQAISCIIETKFVQRGVASPPKEEEKAEKKAKTWDQIKADRVAAKAAQVKTATQTFSTTTQSTYSTVTQPEPTVTVNIPRNSHVVEEMTPMNVHPPQSNQNVQAAFNNLQQPPPQQPNPSTAAKVTQQVYQQHKFNHAQPPPQQPNPSNAVKVTQQMYQNQRVQSEYQKINLNKNYEQVNTRRPNHQVSQTPVVKKPWYQQNPMKDQPTIQKPVNPVAAKNLQQNIRVQPHQQPQHQQPHRHQPQHIQQHQPQKEISLGPDGVYRVKKMKQSQNVYDMNQISKQQVQKIRNNYTQQTNGIQSPQASHLHQSRVHHTQQNMQQQVKTQQLHRNQMNQVRNQMNRNNGQQQQRQQQQQQQNARKQYVRPGYYAQANVNVNQARSVDPSRRSSNPYTPPKHATINDQIRSSYDRNGNPLTNNSQEVQFQTIDNSYQWYGTGVCSNDERVKLSHDPREVKEQKVNKEEVVIPPPQPVQHFSGAPPPQPGQSYTSAHQGYNLDHAAAAVQYSQHFTEPEQKNAVTYTSKSGNAVKTNVKKPTFNNRGPSKTIPSSNDFDTRFQNDSSGSRPRIQQNGSPKQAQTNQSPWKKIQTKVRDMLTTGLEHL
ncbi:predicted protein [Chaetoceros tenuissimus]|uniref:J domain-containing protein n=1 Tax=Chaetoceros tenuissimus TaxID=426638 RepID=A0AAD3H3V7_9STRA|nr:predicted protein [Chaetoceros tenuissimus]